MAVAVVVMTGCGGEAPLPSNDRLLAAFSNGTTGVWVSGHGTVVRPLGSSSDNQRFLVRVNGELSLVVRHQVGDLGPVPADSDDIIAFQGRYEFHGGGGELILTHADPNNPGGGGWIEFNGIRYQ
jgi:hypothetical protein